MHIPLYRYKQLKKNHLNHVTPDHKPISYLKLLKTFLFLLGVEEVNQVRCHGLEAWHGALSSASPPMVVCTIQFALHPTANLELSSVLLHILPSVWKMVLFP